MKEPGGEAVSLSLIVGEHGFSAEIMLANPQVPAGQVKVSCVTPFCLLQ
jgi:hypothetical protein